MLLCTVDVLGVGVTDDAVDDVACWKGTESTPTFTLRLAGTDSGDSSGEEAAGVSAIVSFSSGRTACFDFDIGTLRPDEGVEGTEDGVSGFGDGFTSGAATGIGVTWQAGAVSVVDGGDGDGTSTTVRSGVGGDTTSDGGSPAWSTERGGGDAVSADSSLTAVVVVVVADVDVLSAQTP